MTTTSFKSALAAVVLLASTNASAVNFVDIPSTQVKPIALDVDSVKVRGGHLTAWFMWNDMAATGGVASGKYMTRIDCDAETLATVYTAEYESQDARGVQLSSNKVPSGQIQMLPAIPGSVGSSKVATACYVHMHGTLVGYDAEIDDILGFQTEARKSAAKHAGDPAAARLNCDEFRSLLQTFIAEGDILGQTTLRSGIKEFCTD